MNKAGKIWRTIKLVRAMTNFTRLFSLLVEFFRSGEHWGFLPFLSFLLSFSFRGQVLWINAFVWQGSTKQIRLQWYGKDHSGNTHTRVGKRTFNYHRSLRTSELIFERNGLFFYGSHNSERQIQQWFIIHFYLHICFNY